MSKDTSAVNSQTFPKLRAPAQTKSAKVIDLTLSELRISTTSLNRKNKELKYEKPIEDYHLVDESNCIFVIMDGATRYVAEGKSYPDPSPAALAAKKITHAVHQYLLRALNETSDIHELLLCAIRQANLEVKALNESYFREIDFLEKDFANACGLVGVIRNGSFYYSFLGDPQGYLIRDGDITPFTVTQTEKIDQLYLSLEGEKRGLVDFRKYVCSSVRNKREHAHSFGSLTGEESALDMLEHGKIDLKRGDRIVLTSDGILPLYQRNPSIYLQKRFDLMFDEMERLESVENIRSDDKTLIAIDIS